MIVGAGSPLGLGVAEALYQHGAELILVDRRSLELPFRQSRGGDVRSEVCDVTDEQSVRTLLDSVGGGVNGLIYLPRIRVRKGLGEVTMTDLLEDVAVTVGGLLLAAQGLMPSFRARFEADAQVDSFIISVSSVLANRVSSAESLTYHAAKAAQEQLIRYLAVELGCWGVRTNAVAPGWISKEQSRSERPPFGDHVQFAHALSRTGCLTDVVDSVFFLASRSARFITGQTLYVDGGASLKEAGSLAVDVSALRNT